MLKLLTSVVAAMMFGLSLQAQPINDLVVYAGEPTPFYLVLNGVRQNDEPMTNVRITDLIQPVYDATVIFEDEALGTFSKKIYMSERGREYVYAIKQKKNGEYTFRIQSVTLLNLAPPPPASQRAVVYHATPNAPRQAVTTTTTTRTTTRQAGGVNMNVGVPGFGMNVNINDPLVGGTGVTYTESVTTTSGGGTRTSADHYVMPGYGGPIGCPWPMDNGQFAEVRRSVASKTWDESRLTIAKQVVGANCLTAAQVRDLMTVMEWEETRLDLAKFAYGYTYDIGNYYKLNDAFEWEASIEELSRHINGY